ncbi:predicted protein [Histoplasma capsulatum var. duboisii H88]|uniref:Predicted protein n=1 Tax=Ajellomyces capsulatus (strain H88) TaxID=544711 RepID=F0UL68_AJEC8|nr:predicted protein [Histoplasma capsulatum var. duboisii H88]
MSGPGAPSPGPRSASMGPGGGVPMSQQQQVNGGPPAAASPATSGPPSGVMSQQNLNQIVGKKPSLAVLSLRLARST